jgi:hypothetical protein
VTSGGDEDVDDVQRERRSRGRGRGRRSCPAARRGGGWRSFWASASSVFVDAVDSL